MQEIVGGQLHPQPPPFPPPSHIMTHGEHDAGDVTPPMKAEKKEEEEEEEYDVLSWPAKWGTR